MKRVDFKRIIGYFNPRNIDGFEIDARRDWKIIIISFAIFLPAVLLFNGYVFWKFAGVLEEEIRADEKRTVTIDRASLDKVLKDIFEREKKFEESFQTLKIKDPSL